MIWIITKNNLKRVLHTPIAWVLYSVALFILGLLLLILLNNFYSEIQEKLVHLERPPGLTDLVIAPYLFWVAIVGVVLVPLFAIRTCTEERANGSNLLITSAPLSNLEIVLGKYCALFLLALLFILISSSYALVLGYFTKIDYGKIAAACFGLFLFIASFCSAALFIASLTRIPAVATAMMYALLLLFVMLYLSGSAAASSSELFLYLSNIPHMVELLKGSIDTAHIAYFLLFILLFLSLSVWNLNHKRSV